MPATISAEAHLFLSKGRAKISLDYLSRLLLLGADPFHDPVLEGLEGKESLIYVSKCRATLVLPKRPLRLLLPGLAKGLVRQLMACLKPIVRLGRREELHFFTTQRKVRWQIRLATHAPHGVTFASRICHEWSDVGALAIPSAQVVGDRRVTHREQPSDLAVGDSVRVQPRDGGHPLVAAATA